MDAQLSDQDAIEPRIILPDASILVADAKQACVLSPDGELKLLDLNKNHSLKDSYIVCHAPYTAKKLGLSKKPLLDVLELFAFIYPARFCVPTPTGILNALKIELEEGLEDQAMGIFEALQKMLSDLSGSPQRDILIALTRYMASWAWAPFVLSALGYDVSKADAPIVTKDVALWKNLPKWEDQVPIPDPSQHAITEDETKDQLQSWLNKRKNAEKRDAQISYTKQLTHSFAPIDHEGDLNLVLSEAGTGVGKTLGYLAPSHLWAQKNEGRVWISTYTKNLQSQILQESQNIDLELHMRKGRENYLCLLNLEEQVKRASLSTNPRDVIAAGLMLRWVMTTPDGDLTGTSFPGWLMGLLGLQNSLSLGDRRGECIHAACDNYHSCFIEHSIRGSKNASIVVSNHALVMYLSAIDPADDSLPTRFIFDEGHHLFDAADNAYAVHLSGREASELRRWLLGAEGYKRTRARGLAKRVEGLVEGNDEATKKLQRILHLARCLPQPDWPKRLMKEGEKLTACETFLRHVASMVRARNDGRSKYYSLETAKSPVPDIVASTGQDLVPHFRDLLMALQALSKHFKQQLDEDAEELNTETRKKLSSTIRSLKNRAEIPLMAWVSMLEQLDKPTPEDFLDWFHIERNDGKDVDVGFYRHWVDPMLPFSANIKPFTHGLAITSATLRDEQDSWDIATTQTGLQHFNTPVQFFAAPSPFNYTKQAKVIVVNDLEKNNVEDLATGYREIMLASGGGALGIFTAIQRLKAVHKHLKKHMSEANIPLYAQHVDDMDIATMIDIFKSEEHACLLGTDAVRDGVDVPGNALRTIIFDKVPWPRPTLLHKARRQKFGGRSYDERLTRLKLKQAFGRLIRSQNDRGVFVVMDGMLPSRLLNAFPENIDVQRIGLRDAINTVKDFLK